jgi:bifunctional UDP-N-acetylglucosamine pyrophosphorylase/glucosamine-1-phosphate N-acetyltransferase
MKALILAAGEGRDVVPFTSTRPKPMIRIAGSYLLEHTILKLNECGINDVNIVVGHMQNKVIDTFQGGGDFDTNIHYVSQLGVGKGIGHAISEAKDRFTPGEYFMLIYGDVLTAQNIFRHTLQTFGVSKSAIASINLTPSPEMFGNVYLDPRMKITKIIEKPLHEHRGNYVLSGVFILPYSFFGVLEESDNSMELALSRMAEKNQLAASIWEGGWIDVAYPWDILNANQLLMKEWEKAIIDKSVVLKGHVTIEGPVIIEEGVEIRSGTIIEGPAFIGRNSFIGNNVLIRNFTSVGPESTIGYGVELKNCIMFGRSTVGRLSFIGDSVIGTGVDIGSGTMTINRGELGKTVKTMVHGSSIDTGLKKLGAFIGDDVIVGASNTIIAGTVIESGSSIPHNHSYPV